MDSLLDPFLYELVRARTSKSFSKPRGSAACWGLGNRRAYAE